MEGHILYEPFDVKCLKQIIHTKIRSPEGLEEGKDGYQIWGSFFFLFWAVLGTEARASCMLP